MSRTLYLLVNMLVPLLVGCVAVRISSRVEKLFDRAMYVNLLGLTPVITLLAFWNFSLSQRDVILPVIGMLMQVLPGVLAWLFVRRSHMPHPRKGSIIISSLFASRTTVGMLTVYVFCGEAGYGVGRLVMVLGPICFYLVGFPLASYFANAGHDRMEWRQLVLDPKMIPAIGIVIGILLNRYGPVRPVVVDQLFPWLVAVNAWLFVIPVGMSLKIRGLRGCWKQAAWLIPLRFLLVPLCMGVLCAVFRVSPLAMRAVLLLSLAPVATGAVIMARIYRIDERMTMAAYLMSFGFYVAVIVPLLIVVGLPLGLF